MPVIKCPDCGFRIVQSAVSGVAPICPNCGYPLQAVTGSIVRGQDNSTPTQATDAMLPVIVPGSGASAGTRGRGYSGGPNTGVPPNPFSDYVASGAFEDIEAPQVAAEPSVETEIPRWQPNNGLLSFLRVQTPPNIEGIVIQIQAQEEMPQRGIGGAIGNFFLELIWSVPNVPMSPDKDRVRVTTVRVRQADGSQRDIRMEGYFSGVNMSLGDAVSLWGTKRRGLLIFSRGYNHTSQGPIMTTLQGNTSKGWLLFLIIIALLVLVAYLNGWLTHWPPTFEWPSLQLFNS